MWVMCAEEPLDSATILEAIRIDSTKENFELASSITEESLLSMCSNLLVIDSASGTWKVSHLSVAEYFEQNHWSMQKAHLHAVKSCLLLLLEVFASDEHVVRYSQAGKGVFLEYAMKRWPEHARIQEEEDQADYQSMIPLVKRFLGHINEGSAYFQRYVSCFLDDDDEGPPDIAITPLLIVCIYGLYYTLGDWWECIEISHWQGYTGIESPLTLAAISNSVPLCRKLVQRGEVVNTQDTGRYGSALAAAAAEGNLEIVKFLCLEAGADVNLLLNGGYGSALAAAAYDDNLEIVKVLLDAGANVDLLLNGRYGSALATAACYGNLDIVKFLCLEAGADVNLLLKSSFGSALAAAAYNARLEIVKFLLDAGANMDLPFENGRYGLFDIAEYHDYLEAVLGESDPDRHHGIMTHKPCPR